MPQLDLTNEELDDMRYALAQTAQSNRNFMEILGKNDPAHLHVAES